MYFSSQYLLHSHVFLNWSLNLHRWKSYTVVECSWDSKPPYGPRCVIFNRLSWLLNYQATVRTSVGSHYLVSTSSSLDFNQVPACEPQALRHFTCRSKGTKTTRQSAWASFGNSNDDTSNPSNANFREQANRARIAVWLFPENYPQSMTWIPGLVCLDNYLSRAGIVALCIGQCSLNGLRDTPAA